MTNTIDWLNTGIDFDKAEKSLKEQENKKTAWFIRLRWDC